MYLKVAVCDDDYRIQFVIEDFLKKILDGYAIENEVECYISGEEFCRSYTKGKFGLIFLDIEFVGMNGVDIGKFIREKIGDEDVQIAYISGNNGYAMELFELRPINFLIKPIEIDDIRRIVDKYLLLTKQNEEIFQYKIGRNIFQDSLSNIIFFSSHGRKITIHRKDGEAEFYDTLEQIYNQVKGKYFLYVHKSYLINFHYIKKMEYEQVILRNEIIIPISQSRRSAIRKQFHELKKKGI